MTQSLALLLINQEYPAFQRPAQLGALSLLRVLAPGLQHHMGSKLSRAYGHSNLFDQFTADNLATNLGRESSDVQDTTTILRLIFRFEDMAQRLELAHIVGWLRGELDEARSEVAMQMLVICITELTLQLELQEKTRQTEADSRQHEAVTAPRHESHRDPELTRMAELAMKVQDGMAANYPPLPDNHWLRTGQLNVTHMQTGLPQVIDLDNPADVTINQNPQAILATHLRNQINPDAPPFENVDAFIDPLFQLMDVGAAMVEFAKMNQGDRMPSLGDVYPRDPQHWLYHSDYPFPPMTMRVPAADPRRQRMNDALFLAVRWAIAKATKGGTELPVDVDRIVQNTMVGLFGYNTIDGLPEGNAMEGVSVAPVFEFGLSPLEVQQLHNQNGFPFADGLVDPSAGADKTPEVPAKPAAKKPRAPRSTKPRTSKTKTPEKGQTE